MSDCSRKTVIFTLDQFPWLAPHSPVPGPASTGEKAAEGQGQVILLGETSNTSLVPMNAHYNVLPGRTLAKECKGTRSLLSRFNDLVSNTSACSARGTCRGAEFGQTGGKNHPMRCLQACRQDCSKVSCLMWGPSTGLVWFLLA